jgi:hypothetical protein
LPAFFSASTSRRICSEANTSPPGESTRSTTALTLSSSRACRNSAEVLTPPTLPAGCSPPAISPATTTATCARSSSGLRRASSWAR